MKLQNKIEKVFVNFATGISLGLLISGLISLNIWLDMRIHSFYTIIFATIISTIALQFIKANPYKLFFIIQITTIAFAIIFGKYTRYLYDFREVIGWQNSIKTAQLILGIIFLISNIISFLKIKRIEN